jgi:hypothetical protein
MEELFKKYPKAAEKAVEYYTEMFKKSIEESDVDETYKEYARETVNVDDENVAKMIDVNPRGAFDFFDDNDIYIQITVDLENKCFRYSFNGGLVESNDYLTRKEAETRSIETAFEILNNKLCQIAS